MALHPRVPVEKAFLSSDPVSSAEADAILEIAYLTMASDRRLNDEEIDALGRIAAAIPREGRSPYRAPRTDAGLPQGDMDALLNRFAQTLDRDGLEARLHALAQSLTTPHGRALAYKAACAMALADLDASDREFEFDLQLISELELNQQQADAIAAEVHEALIVDE
jgi:hypothetical protein